MGCDIHGYWEARRPDGVWVAFMPINRDRNYEWFGLVAGVRRENYGLSQIDHHRRGMPSSSSKVWAGYCDDDTGLHSHTWLSPSEAAACYEEYTNIDISYYYESKKVSKEEHRYYTIVTPEHLVKKLMFDYMGYDETIGSWGSNVYKEIPWAGTVQELIGDQDFDEAVRMVIAFDN